jgi:general secretion pathway protein A
MYIEYFKLNEAPFTLTPNPRYLFMSELHREGLAHLLYGVQQPGGFVQLTGEVGSGKTTLCRCLIHQLPPDTDVALIMNPKLTAIELLATVCDEFRIPYPPETGSIKVLIDALNRRLLETHALNRRTVLIIDEAQNLKSEVLEQIRLLTNLETSQEKLLQIILIGQPELLTLLKRRNLRQLSQRITARYHLKPLSRGETHAYIQHRLLVAGRREPLFTRRALNCVYRMSGGVPRLINIICDRALLGAYALDKRMVDASVTRKAARETSGQASRLRRFRPAWLAGIALFALAAAALFFYSPLRSALWNENAPETDLRKNSSAENAGDFSPVLTDVLYGAPRDGAAGFTDLFALWGVTLPADSPEPRCVREIIPGFECLPQFGGWARLRRYDLPAILELLLPDGERRRVVLSGLGGETATLIINGRSLDVSLLEIAMLWDGDFMLIWKPPADARPVSAGATGESVKWIQRALDRLDGKPESDVSGVFDEELKQRVMDFQKKCSLMPDGFAGNETLVRLTLALQGPESLSLSGRASQNPQQESADCWEPLKTPKSRLEAETKAEFTFT